jgi:phosphopantetheine adenylyltransferase
MMVVVYYGFCLTSLPDQERLSSSIFEKLRFGRVVIVIGENPHKTYQVKGVQRKTLIEKMLVGKVPAGNVEVQGMVVAWPIRSLILGGFFSPSRCCARPVVQGLIWRTAKRQGVSLFVRGIRTWAKDGRDERNLQILNTWGPLLLGPLWWPLPTIFMEGKPEYNHVSSTLIRQICRGGGNANNIAQLVPATVLSDVETLYSD